MIDLPRLVSKHGWGLPAHLWREGSMRLYEREIVRSFVRPFFRPGKPDKWVFPVGCYNSGTTITQTLLAAHPDISSLPKEGARFTSMLPAPEDLGWVRMWVRCREYMEMGSATDPRKASRIRRDWAPWLDHTCRPQSVDKAHIRGVFIQRSWFVTDIACPDNLYQLLFFNHFPPFHLYRIKGTS